MRILFLDHPEHDYLSALLYMGLCEELGAESVVDWPVKATFHGKTYRGPVPCHAPDFIGTSEPLPWSKPQPEHGMTEAEILATHFDLIVLASPRQYNADALERLRASGWRPQQRFVMCDGEDYTTIRWDYIERFRPSVYFKTSFVREPFRSYDAEEARMTGLVRLVPFPMASTTGAVAPRPKNIDVAFLGGNNWRPGRVEGRDPTPLGRAALEERLASTFQSFVGGNIADRTQYMDTLARARVAVCVGGSGAEPLRTYEILSCPDTLLMRERINVIAHQPLVDGRTHVGWSTTREPPFDFTEVVDRIRWALDHEEERIAIAREGNTFCAEHYTPRARARQLLTEAFQ